MLNDDIVRADVDSRANQRNAGVGRGLAGYCQIGLIDVDFLALHIYDAAHFEHDHARALGFECFQKRSRTLISQRGDADDLTAAATGGMRGPTLRARESEQLAA